ncbi:MAG: AzlC family ABC transporter permease [Rubrobacter sp.]|nr:AzlC family ABC transporter permease [Rubrobacter sp.]
MWLKHDFFSGVRDVAPILLGIAPFGAISGAAAVGAGLSPEVAFGMSVLIFAGASQLAAVQLISGGASVLVVVLTAAVINLRFMMYSASLSPYLGKLPAAWKALAAYLLVDQAYALAVSRFASEEGPREEPESSRSRGLYFLGAGSALWVVWQACTAAGILLGARVPEGLSLEFVIPLTFMALLFPAITDRPTAAAALAAGLVAVAAEPLPLNLGLVTAAAAGVLVGMLAERKG